jgi:hypothetical protein
MYREREDSLIGKRPEPDEIKGMLKARYFLRGCGSASESHINVNKLRMLDPSD